MALLYKNAKKEVDREYAQLKAKGYTPVDNKDGTYSWVDGKGGKYTGDLDPTGGRDAEASWAQQHFKRQARQDKIMSRKVSGELAMASNKPAEKPTDNTPAPPKGSDNVVEKTKLIEKPGAEDEIIAPGTDVSSKFAPITLPGLNIPQPKKGTQTPVVQPVADQPSGRVDIYDPKSKNYTDRYTLMSKQDRHKGHDVFGKRTEKEIAIEEAGGVTLPFGLSNVLNTAGAPEVENNTTYKAYGNYVDGDKYTLRYNPDYQRDLFTTKEEAEEASKTFGHGEKSTGIIKEVKGEDGKTYFQLDRPWIQHAGAWVGGLASKTIDVASALGAARFGKNVLTKGGTKVINAGKKVIGKKATKLTPKAAEQLTPTAKPIEEAAYKFTKTAANNAPKQGTLFDVPSVAKGAGPAPGKQYATANLVPKATGEQVPMIFRDAAGKIQTTNGAGPPTGPSTIQKVLSSIIKPKAGVKPPSPVKPASFKPQAKTALTGVKNTVVRDRTFSMQRSGGKLVEKGK